MRFTKMHGAGNDYVYVDCHKVTVAQPEDLAIQLSDRHFGIGADGLVLICPSDQADLRMRIFNADGSEAQMCGNAIRCVAKYAFEHDITPGNLLPLKTDKASRANGLDMLVAMEPDADEIRELKVETARGILVVIFAVKNHRAEKMVVNMGQPILDPREIPVDRTGRQVVDSPVRVNGQELQMTCVSMGNPHAVFFCDDLAGIDLLRLGPLLECHRVFPQRANIHFVQCLSSNEVRMRTWERGSGITLACGTGAAAVCAAAKLTGRCDRDLLVHLPGGDLQLHWNPQDNCLYVAGDAVEVFSGTWPTD